MPEADKPDLTTLTVQLLSAYVSNNAVPSDALADLIRTTKAALAESEKTAEAPSAPAPVPAVTAKASLASRDHIISLIDGKPYKTLKRHLFGHGLTPEEYRARYNLPSDKPWSPLAIRSSAAAWPRNSGSAERRGTASTLRHGARAPRRRTRRHRSALLRERPQRHSRRGSPEDDSEALRGRAPVTGQAWQPEEGVRRSN